MRVAILGNSGSGKSTLAKKLSGDSSLPSLLDLDTIYWEPCQVAIERKTSDREADLRRFCSDHDNWVIEGCYADLIETSFPWRPELVLLHPGCEVCVQNCRERPHEAHKYPTKEEQDRRLSFLLQWVSDYYERDGPMSLRGHLDLFERYDGAKRIVTDLNEA
jgi:adenylate kinase family enzyme